MLSSSQERRIAPNTNPTSSLFSNKGNLANDENNGRSFSLAPLRGGEGMWKRNIYPALHKSPRLAVSKLTAKSSIKRDEKESAPLQQRAISEKARLYDKNSMKKIFGEKSPKWTPKSKLHNLEHGMYDHNLFQRRQLEKIFDIPEASPRL